MLTEHIAETAHEVNKAYCESIGDTSQASWAESPDWQKSSAMDGVLATMNDPELTPEGSHENWSAFKLNDGWVYGPLKNPEIKQHPCLVPYDELPEDQKTKDKLYQAVVKTLLTFP